MLEDLLSGPGALALVEYLHSPGTWLTVVIPGLASLAILGFYIRQGKVSFRLQALWLASLVVSLGCARWEITSEVQQLYIYSAFSVACALLLFKRLYLAPPLAYALTYLSLWWVDVVQALRHALVSGNAIDQFYLGVGGAGLMDALVLVPLLTALGVAYAARRIRAQGEGMAEL